MTENNDRRTVIREDEDGTRHIANVPRTPYNDQLSDDQIMDIIDEWMAKGPERERWPMPDPFNKWLMATKPGPPERCPECGCPSLRLATPPDNPDAEAKAVCTMIRCEASPFYRDGTP